MSGEEKGGGGKYIVYGFLWVVWMGLVVVVLRGWEKEKGEMEKGKGLKVEMG